MKAIALAILAGALFAVGLVVSGMTTPRTITAFLDVTGDWDPTLAFVMAGAIGVHAPLAWLARRRERPLFDTRFYVPDGRRIDAPLVGGSILFGIGWGLSGYCPGPALVSLRAGAIEVIVFMGTVISGTLVTVALRRRG
ncbi:MAG: DUF6691 family protein [Kofleriaceae bacterium]